MNFPLFVPVVAYETATVEVGADFTAAGYRPIWAICGASHGSALLYS
jgi:hypothetical protein